MRGSQSAARAEQPQKHAEAGVQSVRHSHREKTPLGLLCLTALGVVYGDIGTSPLYAIQLCFFGPHGVPVTHANVLGVLSLIFWCLVIVVSVKYLLYVLRADNRGEGGILALMALVRGDREGRNQSILVMLGLFGAALLFGDGVLTPAISVLSAIEGLEVATPLFTPVTVPLTVIILVGLFLLQRRGTAGVGAVFGPVVMVWFGTLAVLGTLSIVHQPGVLRAVNPMHALRFFTDNGLTGYLVLGAVFLVATGAEALYADLGHFGIIPIQIDWFLLVAPALVLNYFGQGALLLQDPSAAHNPFYRLAPNWALYPLVLLATLATVIASQAVISGVFSLTRQAVQLGFAPRVEIIHTSSREIGQIYIPGANWALMVGTLALVVAFEKSSNLAAAYGVAVTTTMVITTFLAFLVAYRLWKWPLLVALGLTAGFLVVDFAFFGANLAKVAQGGWFPLSVGVVGFLMFTTWQKGREVLAGEMAKTALPLAAFVQDLQQNDLIRVPGTAVFLNSSPHGTPVALLHNLKLNRIVHEENIVVTVLTEEMPYVPQARRVEVRPMAAGFCRLIVRYGFMEDPDVPAALGAARDFGLRVDPGNVTYILSNNTLIPSRGSGMSFWRRRVFAYMARNALRPTQFFHLPVNRVIELGMQIRI
jgi:KUP system potassium uptake protein